MACGLAMLTACSQGVSPLQPAPGTEASSGGSAACAGGLFTETTLTPAVDFTGTLGVLRVRTVAVDVAAVRRSADSRAPITLNLFPDACLVADVTDIAYDKDGRLIWTGKIAGGPDGSAVTLVAADGVILGSVDAAGPAFYQVRYAGNGVHVVMRINPAVYPPD
jgi:hypothetical protein